MGTTVTLAILSNEQDTSPGISQIGLKLGCGTDV